MGRGFGVLEDACNGAGCALETSFAPTFKRELDQQGGLILFGSAEKDLARDRGGVLYGIMKVVGIFIGFHHIDDCFDPDASRQNFCVEILQEGLRPVGCEMVGGRMPVAIVPDGPQLEQAAIHEAGDCHPGDALRGHAVQESIAIYLGGKPFICLFKGLVERLGEILEMRVVGQGLLLPCGAVEEKVGLVPSGRQPAGGCNAQGGKSYPSAP